MPKHAAPSVTLEYTCAGPCGSNAVEVEGEICVECIDQHDPSVPHVYRQSCSPICTNILKAYRSYASDYVLFVLGTSTSRGLIPFAHTTLRRSRFDGNTLAEVASHVHDDCQPDCPAYYLGLTYMEK